MEQTRHSSIDKTSRTFFPPITGFFTALILDWLWGIETSISHEQELATPGIVYLYGLYAFLIFAVIVYLFQYFVIVPQTAVSVKRNVHRAFIIGIIISTTLTIVGCTLLHVPLREATTLFFSMFRPYEGFWLGNLGLIAIMNANRKYHHPMKNKSDENEYPEVDHLLGHFSKTELEEFSKNLKQVVNWTEKLSPAADEVPSDLATVFRKTNPVIGEHALYKISGAEVFWRLDSTNKATYCRLLPMAIQQRDEHYDFDLRLLEAHGRILVFQTCVSTWDGAPTAETAGFVDDVDAPPIDTWFYIGNKVRASDPDYSMALFCWIPNKFIPVMMAAQAVEILDSYTWIAPDDPVLQSRIIDPA